VLDYYTVLEENALDCEQGAESRIDGLNDIDQDIRAALHEKPFLSGRNLTKKTYVPSTIVDRQLTNFMGFVFRHLRCVLPKLNGA
jgi:hypothetical protein